MMPQTDRTLDSRGRIVLPADMRHSLNWKSGTHLLVLQKEDTLILERYEGSCFVCGCDHSLVKIHGLFVCRRCMDIIFSKTENAERLLQNILPFSFFHALCL